MEPARVTVSRQAPEDVRIRQLVVSLDGRTVATLLFGETFTAEVPPGPHRLRVHNTLVWRTVDFEAREGEPLRFSVVNRAGFGTYTMIGLLGAGPLYVTISRERE